MKIRLIAIMLFAAMSVATAPQVFVAGAQDHKEYKSDLAEREEIRQTYQLAPGSRVEVSSINGPVEIETTNGNTAEVHIIRSARTKEDLQYRKILINQKSGGLIVYGEKNSDGDHKDIQVRHRVTMKIPRRVDLHVSSVNGKTKVGEIDGPVEFSSINGSLEVGQASGHAELTSINGRVIMTLSEVSNRGIRIRHINGSIQLRFLEGVNADVEVTHINGSVNPEVSDVSLHEKKRDSYRAQIGSGGTPITMAHINGSVTIRSGSGATR